MSNCVHLYVMLKAWYQSNRCTEQTRHNYWHYVYTTKVQASGQCMHFSLYMRNHHRVD